MKKVVFITNYFGNGGAAAVMKSIITKLKDTYDIKLISFIDDDKKYDIPSGVDYIRLNSKMKLSKLEKLKSILKLRKILKSEKDSIIISFEYFVNIRTIISAIGLKSRVIISERNDPSRVGNNIRYLRNFIYRFSDVLVCQTEDAKKYFPSYIKKKTFIILNPLNPDLPTAYNGVREKVIVNFCRLEKQKNLKMLIDSFDIVYKKYPDYKLNIYGDGKEKDELLKYIKSKKSKNNIVIFPFNKKIHEKVKKSAVFVSSSDYEGLSNSMLEAMAIGLPTFCTDCPCGGARMVIKDGYNGILVPVGDVKKMKDAMLSVLDNSNYSLKLSINSRKIKEELSLDNICDLWIRCIEGDIEHD